MCCPTRIACIQTFFFVHCVSTVHWLNVMILGCWGFYGPLVARGADALATEWTVTQDPKNEIHSLKTYFDTSVFPILRLTFRRLMSTIVDVPHR